MCEESRKTEAAEKHSFIESGRSSAVSNVTFCVQHFGNVEVFLCYVKSQVQIPQRIILNKEAQFCITEQQCRT